MHRASGPCGNKIEPWRQDRLCVYTTRAQEFRETAVAPIPICRLPYRRARVVGKQTSDAQ